jgi:hypothetical protein
MALPDYLEIGGPLPCSEGGTLERPRNRALRPNRILIVAPTDITAYQASRALPILLTVAVSRAFLTIRVECRENLPALAVAGKPLDQDVVSDPARVATLQSSVNGQPFTRLLPKVQLDPCRRYGRFPCATRRLGVTPLSRPRGLSARLNGFNLHASHSAASPNDTETPLTPGRLLGLVFQFLLVSALTAP